MATTYKKLITDSEFNAALENKVDKTLKINNKPLDNDVNLTASDIGLGNVLNEEQIPATAKGAANGVAELNANGKVPDSQLPAIIDEYASSASFPSADGAAAHRLYVDKSTNRAYRWTGNTYIEVSPMRFGTTSDTAYAGDKGAKNANDITTLTNAHNSLSGIVSTLQTDMNNKVSTSQLGVRNGVATLGTDGKVPAVQLPSYVDDVLEYANKAAFPTVGEASKIYLDKEANLSYRWSGSAYSLIGPELALGETETTAYPGNKGKANAEAIAALQAAAPTAIATSTVDSLSSEIFGV